MTRSYTGRSGDPKIVIGVASWIPLFAQTCTRLTAYRIMSSHVISISYKGVSHNYLSSFYGVYRVE